MDAKLPLLLIISGALGACASTPTPRPSVTLSVIATVTAAATSPTPSVTDAPVPALTVDRPTVIVSPSVHLKDGQVVEVRVTGFGVGGKVWLSECASAAAATDLGCGVDLAAQPFLVTDDNRAEAGSLVVRARASGVALSAGPSTPAWIGA
ncbi:MAG: neocarzinostatin apoprotein domain-containing protein [Chloroflexota bacterium]|nr:neocarzinostatin apoprotein domain-containing protein [Chloroflexota bacterium]